MKKVAIIGTAGVPARYGGFETLTHQLVDQLKDDFDLSVYCSNKYYPKSERKSHWNGARLFHLPFNANGIQSIIYDCLSIIHALFYADILLILGVSGGILIPFVKWFTGKRIVVNIDGLEWRRDKWSYPVQRFLKISEYLAVRYSHADITDNAAIQRYTARNYRTLSYLVEYGADHVEPQKLTNDDYAEYPFLRLPYAFKVARIEPENNVQMILQAFAEVGNKTLVIVGNWNASTYGQELRKTFQQCKNIHLLDPIYEQQKLDKLRSNCHVYVHGHSAGGTNPSLVEAMYLGLPILAYDVSYNRATTENQAAYFKTANQLSELLDELNLEEYRELARQMKAIAMRRYTWEHIAKRYSQLFLTFDYQYTKKPVSSALSRLSSHQLLRNGMAHLQRPLLPLFETQNELK